MFRKFFRIRLESLFYFFHLHFYLFPLGLVPAMGLMVTLFFSSFTNISGLDPTKEKSPNSSSSKFKKKRKEKGLSFLMIYITQMEEDGNLALNL